MSLEIRVLPIDQLKPAPYNPRKPVRPGSPAYRKLWPSAKEYLITLNDAANDAVIDMIMSGAGDYANALDRAMTAIYAGKDIQSGLNDAAKEWESITDKLGRDKQKAAYAQFLKLPGATANNTVSKLGLGVHIT